MSTSVCLPCSPSLSYTFEVPDVSLVLYNKYYVGMLKPLLSDTHTKEKTINCCIQVVQNESYHGRRLNPLQHTHI